MGGAGLGIRAWGQGASRTLISDSRIRLREYIGVIKEIPGKYRLPDDASLAELRRAAEDASAERNAALERTREMVSEEGRAFSEALKEKGLTFDQLMKKSTLKHPEWTEAQHLRGIVESSSHSRPSVTAVAKGLSYAEHAGKALMVVGAAVDGYSLGTEIDKSLQTGNWGNTEKEAARITGGWTGAWAGGEAGAWIGGSIGAFGGPVGIAVGGFIGGLAGGIAGYWKGSEAGEYYYDAATK
ncbi:MAG TPA: hypothetical protein VII47_12350 [Actinomycetota bacterium]